MIIPRLKWGVSAGGGAGPDWGRDPCFAETLGKGKTKGGRKGERDTDPGHLSSFRRLCFLTEEGIMEFLWSLPKHLAIKKKRGKKRKKEKNSTDVYSEWVRNRPGRQAGAFFCPGITKRKRKERKRKGRGGDEQPDETWNFPHVFVGSLRSEKGGTETNNYPCSNLPA